MKTEEYIEKLREANLKPFLFPVISLKFTNNLRPLCIGFYASWGSGKSFAMNLTEFCTKMMNLASLIDAYATDTDKGCECAKAAENRLKVHNVLGASSSGGHTHQAPLHTLISQLMFDDGRYDELNDIYMWAMVNISNNDVVPHARTRPYTLFSFRSFFTAPVP